VKCVSESKGGKKTGKKVGIVRSLYTGPVSNIGVINGWGRTPGTVTVKK
jgi:hypothetical protein